MTMTREPYINFRGLQGKGSSVSGDECTAISTLIAHVNINIYYVNYYFLLILVH